MTWQREKLLHSQTSKYNKEETAISLLSSSSEDNIVDNVIQSSQILGNLDVFYRNGYYTSCCSADIGVLSNADSEQAVPQQGLDEEGILTKNSGLLQRS